RAPGALVRAGESGNPRGNHPKLQGICLMNPEQAYQLDGQVVLVTGASRGIGRATADWLKAQGGDVFGTATSTAGAEKISERLGEDRGLCLDVTDATAVEQTVAAIRERAGAVTVLVNNAAITRDQLLMRLK